jgi:hypothetical protein
MRPTHPKSKFHQFPAHDEMISRFGDRHPHHHGPPGRLIGHEKHGSQPTRLFLKLALVDAVARGAKRRMRSMHKKSVRKFVSHVAALSHWGMPLVVNNAAAPAIEYRDRREGRAMRVN